MSTRMIATRTTYNLGPIDRIPPGEGRTFDIGDHSVAVFRTRENILHAVQAFCPHRSGPLADGIIGDGKVICPLHSYKFNIVTGQPLGDDCAALEVYRVSLTGNGEIILQLPDIKKGNARLAVGPNPNES